MRTPDGRVVSRHLTPWVASFIGFVLLNAAFFLAGCPSPCEGAGCGALYPRASLGIFTAEQLGAAEVDALAPSAEVSGSDADGYDWAVTGAEDGLLVGIPAAGQARWYDRDALKDGAGPTRTLADDGVDDRFGAAVAVGVGAGGAPRLIVGAPGRAGGPTLPATGAVLLYEGVDATLEGSVEPTVVLGFEAEGHLGEGVWACGDLDADGTPDWAASAPWSAAGGVDLGGTLVVGLSSAPAATSAADLPRRSGTTSGERFGAAVSCAASLDEDLVPELVVASPYADAVGRDGVGAVSIWVGPIADLDSTAPTLTLTGPERGASFGAALAVGDLDGDGASELVVGAPEVDGGATGDDAAGAVYVYDSQTVRDKLRSPVELPTLGADRILRGEFVRGRFGAAVQIADLDGDGVGDLVVGAPGTNRTGEASATRAGAATIWWGPHTAWPVTQFTSDAPVTVAADRQYLETGNVVAITDLDAGGPADLVLLTRQASELP